MSNELTIATITATIQDILQSTVDAKLPGTIVTRGNPVVSDEGIPKKRLNVKMYQSNANTSLRDADPRKGRPGGESKPTEVPQDLYYIVSAYGDDEKSEPDILLGCALSAFGRKASITPQMIQETINKSQNSHLLASNLHEQVTMITVEQFAMTKEELAKIWSSYYQLPSPVFIILHASVAQIDVNRPGRRALPVRGTAFYTTASSPFISQVISNAGANQPIVSDSILAIRGMNLGSSNLYIKIGDAKIKPQLLQSQEIKIDLCSLSNDERSALRAGVQSLQMLQQVPKQAKYEPQQVVGSNVVPFVLCPKVKLTQAINIEENSDNFYTAEIKVELDIAVGTGQRVSLFLNERSGSREAAYIFNANARTEDSKVVTFAVNDVKKGEYLVRVQVDGAESPLQVDTQPNSPTFEQYISPVVTIG